MLVAAVIRGTIGRSWGKARTYSGVSCDGIRRCKCGIRYGWVEEAMLSNVFCVVPCRIIAWFWVITRHARKGNLLKARA